MISEGQSHGPAEVHFPSPPVRAGNAEFQLVSEDVPFFPSPGSWTPEFHRGLLEVVVNDEVSWRWSRCPGAQVSLVGTASGVLEKEPDTESPGSDFGRLPGGKMGQDGRCQMASTGVWALVTPPRFGRC